MIPFQTIINDWYNSVYEPSYDTTTATASAQAGSK